MFSISNATEYISFPNMIKMSYYV